MSFACPSSPNSRWGPNRKLIDDIERRNFVSSLSLNLIFNEERYGPALRELFSFVVLEGELHGLQVLHTLQDSAATTGSSRLIIRKLCLFVGSESVRSPPPPPPAAEQQAIAAADAAAAALDAALAQWAAAMEAGTPVGQLGGLAAYQALLQRRRNRPAVVEQPPVPVETGLPTPLSWITAQMILQRSPFIQTLTLKLPRLQKLDESEMLTLTQFKQLRKLDIAGHVTFQQLAVIVAQNAHLKDLEVTFMKPEAVPTAAPATATATAAPGNAAPTTTTATATDGSTGNTALAASAAVPAIDASSSTAVQPPPVVPVPVPVQGSLGTMHLTALSLAYCQMDNAELAEILRASKDTLRNLSISNLKGITRFGFKAALKAVGKDLRVLALQKLTFTAVATQDPLLPLAHLLDDLPTVCPRLEELTVASAKICSEQHFLTAVVPGLFLTQLELDYTAPTIGTSTIMEMITHLPAGRMETLCFGPEMSHLSTPEVQRACQEIGIVLLGGSVE